MPQLSVLLPVYNAEDTIAGALKSTLRDLPRDAEVLVLDDGSTDATLEAIDTLNDRRVRVHSRPNLGVAASLNELLASTDSEFVARMDADDLVIAGRFRRQLAALTTGNAAEPCDAVFTTVVELKSRAPSLPRPSSIGSAEFGLHLLLTNPVAHSTLMARRSALDRAGGYRLLPTEDYDLWLRLASAGTPMRRMALPGIAYRLHAGQVTAAESWRRRSWEDASIAASFADLAERLTGARAHRITSLSIDDSLTTVEKLEQFEEFAKRFTEALASHTPLVQRTLKRKLAQRREWLRAQMAKRLELGHELGAPAHEAPGTCAAVVREASHTAPATQRVDLTKRESFRAVRAADREANRAYPKSRWVLRWFRSAQRWRARKGLIARAAYILCGGSYKFVTEWIMGIELPVSTEVGPGLRLRHGIGLVVNPASRIGANVMLRQGVTLGNRTRSDDCPTIEDDVEIGVGAVIIGAITVGQGARIGPNAVVFTDVPAGGVVYSPVSERRP